MKWNDAGTLQWQRQYQLASVDAVGVVSDGVNIYTVGSTDSGVSPGYVFVVRWDSAGNIVWQRRYDNTTAEAITAPTHGASISGGQIAVAFGKHSAPYVLRIPVDGAPAGATWSFDTRTWNVTTLGSSAITPTHTTASPVWAWAVGTPSWVAGTLVEAAVTPTVATTKVQVR
jgi:hypothetical protein